MNMGYVHYLFDEVGLGFYFFLFFLFFFVICLLWNLFSLSWSHFHSR
jgi:hypothetical protein